MSKNSRGRNRKRSHKYVVAFEIFSHARCVTIFRSLCLFDLTAQEICLGYG